MRKDSLGDRMKRYENVNRHFLIPRTYAIIRIDGKAFHTFTKNLDKPWDQRLSDAMIYASSQLFSKIQGAKYAYTQSDEISLVITDFDTYETQSWFNNNLQKIVSVSASIATKSFTYKWISSKLEENPSAALQECDFPEFDSRVFQLPNREEVINYFIWRQQDAVRNSISGLAQSLYSHKELHKKNQSEMQEMCFQKGKNWNDVPIMHKRGVGIKKWVDDIGADIERHIIEPDFNIPIFNKERDYLNNIIPDYI